ncbi:MAG: hypothetical protein M3T49_07615 [Candidatus Eremiobacteraeota bacterium]|nr:hypothetical protein [Candidatus Eremiobacteraeota bacterium]
MAEPARLLLVRLDGVGDALACVPALEGLRRAWPRMEFGAVCSAANAALFSDRVTDVFVYDGKSDVRAFAELLHSRRFSHALVATEEPIGYRIAALSGAARRAGFWHGLEKAFKSLWQRALLTDAVYRPAAWWKNSEHECETIYRLARALGARLPVPCDPAALSAWIQVDAVGFGAARGALGVQVSPKLMTGGWGPAAWAALLSTALAASTLDRCLMLVPAADARLARAIADAMPVGLRRDVSLAVFAHMPAWLGAISSLRALVSADTGAAHAAGMLGTPVVDLFASSRFAQLSRQWRPWAAPSHCAQLPVWRMGVERSFGTQIGQWIAGLLQPPIGASVGTPAGG